VKKGGHRPLTTNPNSEVANAANIPARDINNNSVHPRIGRDKWADMLSGDFLEANPLDRICHETVKKGGHRPLTTNPNSEVANAANIPARLDQMRDKWADMLSGDFLEANPLDRIWSSRAGMFAAFATASKKSPLSISAHLSRPILGWTLLLLISSL
jgi:hypothetical protein